MSGAKNRLPEKLGVYEIKEELGSGGMGVVYKAFDISLQREVAVKVLPHELSSDKEFETRFIREARVAAKLDHPNIVQIYFAGKQSGILFIAMQFIEGKDLHECIKEKGKFEWQEALEIARQVADALNHAHKSGLIHRDVKPSNIMINGLGKAKLMDFGLARSYLQKDITQSNVFFGTPAYCSPEQFETTKLDNRTDIYSLGVVIYEMLTGRVPFVAETPVGIYNKMKQESPLPIRTFNPRIPKNVEKLVEKMMHPSKDERFQNFDEVIEEIDYLIGYKKTTSRRLIAKKSRLRNSLIVTGGIALIICGFILLYFMAGKKSQTAPPALTTNNKPEKKIRLFAFRFKNLKPGVENSYADAIPDMLLANLACQYPSIDILTLDEILNIIDDIEIGYEERITPKARQVLKKFGVDVYLTGKYICEKGIIRAWLTGYSLSSKPLCRAIPVIQKENQSIFSLVDELAHAVYTELQKFNKTYKIAKEIACKMPAAKPIQDTQTIFLSNIIVPFVEKDSQALAKSKMGKARLRYRIHNPEKLAKLYYMNVQHLRNTIHKQKLNYDVCELKNVQTQIGLTLQNRHEAKKIKAMLKKFLKKLETQQKEFEEVKK